MNMNCNLELRLSHPPSPSPPVIPNHQQSQQLTIFYNGRICACDVTEIQARAILGQATKEIDRERCNRRSNTDANVSNSAFPWVPMSPPQGTQLSSASPSPSSSSSGLSMKKSLQSFLQKRKYRQLATSPYSTATRRD